MRLLSFLPCALLVAACGSAEQTGSLSSSLTRPVDVRVVEDGDVFTMHGGKCAPRASGDKATHSANGRSRRTQRLDPKRIRG
jgi:hypothetical protein